MVVLRNVVMTCALAAGIAGCGRRSFEQREDAATDAARDGGSSDATRPGTLVQSAGAVSSSVATLSATLSSVPATDHVLVLVGAANIAPITTPTGGSSAWTRATYSPTNANIEIWYGLGDGASTTVTIQTIGATGMTLWVGEWAGISITSPLDGVNAMAGTTSPASAGTVNVGTPPELLVFAVNSYLPNTFGTPTGGTWTEIDTRLGDSMQRVWVQIATTAGGLAPAVDETRHSWDAAIAGFRINP
jgi:hypothetical protein